MKDLILVESPTKARTLNRFLDGKYDILASMGHVRDLPKGDLGVDVDKKFRPTYVVPDSKKKTVSELKSHAKKAGSIILATDPDREGEAIAYHLREILKEGHSAKDFKRIVFHEITKTAIENALKEARTVNAHLVDAQTARRVLDRVVGYKLSPVLWRKVRGKLSAGRVQSIALRLVVEREAEIHDFQSHPFCRVNAFLVPKKHSGEIEFSLVAIDGEKIEKRESIDLYDGKYTYSLTTLDKQAADEILKHFSKYIFEITDLSKKETKRHPGPPFTTSTLQQTASGRFSYSSKRTMQLAQKLYEEGFITYHRTDSVHLSQQFVEKARTFIESEFGEKFLSEGVRTYKTKSKLAQEAHEAIRPTSVENKEKAVAAELGAQAAKLYSLIYKRSIATQMAPAVFNSTKVIVTAKNGKAYTLEANGKIMIFPGFLKVWKIEDQDQTLPEMNVGEKLSYKKGEVTEHETNPPPRYSEASLISSLENHGIGRPSTYAPTISTIQDRDYVVKQSGSFYPTYVGIAVIHLLRDHFEQYFNLQFTAKMEDGLDEIARGELDWEKFLSAFYFGDKSHNGLLKQIDDQLPKIDYPAIPVGRDPKTKEEIYVRIGKQFPYVQRGEGEKADRAPLPLDLMVGDLTVNKAQELLENSESEEKVFGKDEDGNEIMLKVGPYGPYIQLGEGEGKKKPKRVAIPRDKEVTAVDLEYAQKLLSLPRTIGMDTKTGAEVVSSIGRFGPYLKRGSQYRSLEESEQMFTIELKDALHLLATAPGKKVIKELGKHPENGNNVEVMDGRYGPYVTDGSVNASVPKDVKPEEITLDAAVDLLKTSGKKKKKGGFRRRKKK